ncbi:hypothetical protein D3C81_1295440 [compost metagenome]
MTSGRLPPRLIRYGLSTLSTPLMMNVPQMPRNMAIPYSPFQTSHAVAGIHTSGGPIGIRLSMNVTMPSTSAPGTPAIRNPISARIAWAAAVPITPFTTRCTVPATSSM